MAISALCLIGSVAQAHYHLTFKNKTLHAHAEFEVTPNVASEAVLLLDFKDAAAHENTEIADAVEVVLWMPSMGHGSSPTLVERVLDENGNVVIGAYRVSDMFFLMAGTWEVRVVLTAADGTSETKTFNVKL